MEYTCSGRVADCSSQDRGAAPKSSRHYGSEWEGARGEELLCGRSGRELGRGVLAENRTQGMLLRACAGWLGRWRDEGVGDDSSLDL